MQSKYNDTAGMPVAKATPIDAKKIIIDSESDPRNIKMFSNWSEENPDLSKTNKIATVIVRT